MGYDVNKTAKCKQSKPGKICGALHGYVNRKFLFTCFVYVLFTYKSPVNQYIIYNVNNVNKNMYINSSSMFIIVSTYYFT